MKVIESSVTGKPGAYEGLLALQVDQRVHVKIIWVDSDKAVAERRAAQVTRLVERLWATQRVEHRGLYRALVDDGHIQVSVKWSEK